MINVLFAGNDGVFDGILTCMLSIFLRTITKEPFTFYIFTMDVSHIKSSYIAISEEKTEYLDSIAKSYNKDSKVVRMDVIENYNRVFANCPNELTYCSPYTLLRLLADEMDEIPDKLLYLDADILFNRDITLLYNHDISDYEYAAARDHYGKYLINPNYINAGVLLLNMKKIRQTGLFSKARKLLSEKKLLFADQFLHKHTVVRHFSKRLFYTPYPHTENIKQWQISKVYRIFRYDAFDDIFFEYIYLKKKFERDIKGNTNE